MAKLKDGTIEWIQVAKAVGIILVVIGHYSPDNSPDYWLLGRKIIYTFHMPLFLVISGFLFAKTAHGYGELLKRKVIRLAVPFVSIAVIALLLKSGAGLAFKLDHPVDLNSTIQVLLQPEHSYMPLLWFIHTLMLIFVVYPLLVRFGGHAGVFALSVLLNFLGAGNWLLLGTLVKSMPFFAFGALIAANEDALSAWPRWGWGTLAAVLFAGCALATAVAEPMNSASVFYTICAGVSGSVGVIILSAWMVENARGKVLDALETIGEYSMSIYLLHTFFESAIRIMTRAGAPAQAWPFELSAALAITCGIAFPLVLEMFALRRFALTRRLILGLP